MKRIISLLLILPFAIMCCGCQQDIPDHTTPSDTQPAGEVQTPTDGTGDPNATDAPLEVSYTAKEFRKIALLDVGVNFGVVADEGPGRINIQVFRSLDEVENSKLENWKFFNAYDDTFFENNTLIVVVGYYPWLPAEFTLPELIKNAPDSYTASITMFTPIQPVDVSIYPCVETFVIEVYEKISVDADVSADITLIWDNDRDYCESSNS